MFAPLAAGPLSPAPLHIPDGFLSLPVSLLCWLLAVLFLGIALRRAQDQIGERSIPLMGVMAAFLFAAQMINFPVAGGTSGHLLGGALAAITLGPWAGMLVMAAVVIVQAVLFQDGGLLVMGANLLNMGVLTTLIGYGLYRGVTGRSPRVRLMTAGAAAWLSVMAGALATALQLWLSGTSPLRLVAPAMLGVHALIGVGEALITVAALAFILRTRPDVVQTASGQPGSLRWAAVGMALSLGVVLLSPFASANPDGLERVAQDLGFLDQGTAAPLTLLQDYSLPILGDTPFSTILAGLAGALVAATLILALLRVLARQRPA